MEMEELYEDINTTKNKEDGSFIAVNAKIV